jgi:hypothetical protein
MKSCRNKSVVDLFYKIYFIPHRPRSISINFSGIFQFFYIRARRFTIKRRATELNGRYITQTPFLKETCTTTLTDCAVYILQKLILQCRLLSPVRGSCVRSWEKRKKKKKSRFISRLLAPIIITVVA